MAKRFAYCLYCDMYKLCTIVNGELTCDSCRKELNDE